MTKIYETPYGAVHIPIVSPIITVRTSGGWDSALLLYMVAKTCVEAKANAIIQPITVVRTNEDEYPDWHRVDNLPIVDVIVDWVRSEFPTADVKDKIWKDAFKWWENGNISYTDAQRDLVREAAEASPPMHQSWHDCQLHDYNGVTKNPPVPMLIADKHQYRELKRDHNDANSPAVAEDSCTVIHGPHNLNRRMVEPFRNADKRVCMYLARQFGIFEKLNTISRSCEGDRESTNSWTKVCGICWWCQEREWACKETS
tara:strand:- start:2685 stop:3455 length:771 start_codon:yes stop_codon:yes gene_type:complete